MTTINLGTPNPKQRLLYLSAAKFTGYGGAMGGGKSHALRAKAVMLALAHEKLNILIVRRTMPELRENHILPLRELLGNVARFSKTEGSFYFPNGSRIRCGYCEQEDDVYRYQGTEWDVILVDEATQQTWFQIQYLMSRLRTTKRNFKTRMYLTANPGGVGHNWFKRLFIDRLYLPGERPEDYLFIPARVEDNAVLLQADPQYKALLDKLPDKLRRAYRDGDWNVFSGQFFENLVTRPGENGRWSHVIEPFEIPGEWKIYRSFDFGYAKPFSVGWWAVDYDGRLYRILELYGCVPNDPNVGVKWAPDRIFKEIARIEREHRWLKGKQILGVADPSIWDKSRGDSVADVAARQGIWFAPGDNQRIPGWMQVHYRLQFDEEGVPMLYVFDTCKAFLRTMPILQYSDIRPEDLDTDGEDHVADEVRYMCMQHVIKPRETAERPAVPDDPLDLNKDKRYRRYGGL